jgi:peptidoglycan/xylan/chitin deacetylase (PgdA/CDA1 family)
MPRNLPSPKHPHHLLSIAILAWGLFFPLMGQENSTTGSNSLVSPPPSVAVTNASPSSSATTQAPPLANAASSKTPAASSLSTNAASSPTSPASSPVTSASKSEAQPAALEASAIILGYHQFTAAGVHSKNIYSMDAGAFEDEMKYLKDSGCHVVPLSAVVAFVEGKGSLPPHAVAITIDDGYKSPLLYAAPILKKYGYPWTFFCYTDYINLNRFAASWKDLQELGKEGIDVECHSKSHPFLSHKNGKTPEEYDKWLTAETAGAKSTLEAHLHKPIIYFAYPYGDYNKEVQDKLIASGFQAIFTVAGNPVHATTSPYRMGRYVITTPEEKDFASYLRQGALSIMAATPAPGATISDPRPIISAVLNYAGHLDPKSIEARVKGFGQVPVDYDPATFTVRLYLQRDLIQPVVDVTIHVKDATVRQTLVTSWQFNYEPSNSSNALPPIGPAKRITPTPAAASTKGNT